MKESKNAEKPSFIYRDGMIADKEYDITGFSLTNVKYMKRWYLFYNDRDAKSQRLVDQMSHQVGDLLQKEKKVNYRQNHCRMVVTRYSKAIGRCFLSVARIS